MRILAAYLSVLAIGTAWSSPPACWATAPNIVFIMADDLGYGDLGCYGQASIETPSIDRLAAEGIRFTQAYAGSCVCAPSRAVLMTGLDTGRAPVRDNIPHYRSYLEESDVTVAEILQQAGYRTGGVGKWSLGDAGAVGRATNQGFDHWFGYLNQDHAHYYFPRYLDDDETTLVLPGNDVTHTHYSHDLLTERALEFIRNAGDEPFFLYVAYTLPHFASEEEDPTQLPIPSDSPYSDRPWSQKEKNYAAMVTRFDRDVGRIVQLIDELGLRESTLIIVTSDNGPWGQAPTRFDSNGKLRGEKRSLYEGGIRVPLVARQPGFVPAGETSDAVIAFCDMLPTLAELAGAKTPVAGDGISIIRALQGNPLEHERDYLYWDYGHCRRRYDQAVRMKDWKGVRRGAEGPIELYDLRHDPGETHDVAAAHPSVVDRLAAVMEQAVVPSRRYPVGKLYTGDPIWQRAQDASDE